MFHLLYIPYVGAIGHHFHVFVIYKTCNKGNIKKVRYVFEAYY